MVTKVIVEVRLYQFRINSLNCVRCAESVALRRSKVMFKAHQGKFLLSRVSKSVPGYLDSVVNTPTDEAE
jgi:hypothetical protein